MSNAGSGIGAQVFGVASLSGTGYNLNERGRDAVEQEPVTEATLQVILDRVIAPLQRGLSENTDLLSRVDERTIAINDRLSKGDDKLDRHDDHLSRVDKQLTTLEANAKTAGTHAGRRWGIGLGLGTPVVIFLVRLAWESLSN